MTTTDKIRTLNRVAERFNAAGITWAVGASAMLFLRGRAESFHDIDIMVAEEHIATAWALLEQMGTLKPSLPNDRYLTRHFHEFIIDGTDIDLIAGFVIVSDGVAHECPLLLNDITMTYLDCGTPVPLHSISVWRKYYTLMGRMEKANSI